MVKLNDLLNHNLHTATAPGMDFDKWKKSHQPFHWLAEFYDIIYGNGGFDVIIGNPPYVEVSGIQYSINFASNAYSNLYAYCTERCKLIQNTSSYFGLIVPMSLTSIREYSNLRIYINNSYKRLYVTNHAIRPISLFIGVSQRVSIMIETNASNSSRIFTTNYLRTKHLQNLFKTMSYTIGNFDKDRDFLLPKIGNHLLSDIYMKMHLKQKDIINHKSLNSKSVLYLKDYGETYWVFPFNFYPCLTPVKSYKSISFDQDALDAIYISLNSSTFYIFYTILSDCWHLGMWHFSEFPISVASVDNTLSKKLSESVKKNRIVRYDKRAGGDIYEYKIYKSKPIIDEIDKVLAKHYGFTEEELDFIINYDIKYRMGDELGEESNSEPQPKVSQPEKPQPAKQRQKPVEQEPKPKDNMLTMKVGKETIERIKSGEKTTFKRYLDDEDFAKEVLVTENGKVKLSKDHCPYTAKNITSIKLVCDGESLVKAVTKISFRAGTNQQGKTAWKIIFHF